MMAHRRWLPIAALLVFVAPAASGQGSALTPAQAGAFMGTWVIDMTEPAAFKGTHTVRIWDKNGVVAASLQTGAFPPHNVTGIVKDGNMLVLTISHEAQPAMLENGAPIWAVISLTLDGDTMRVAQMLERSQTIKRGTGKRQAD
jgi:hypothetical protein